MCALLKAVKLGLSVFNMPVGIPHTMEKCMRNWKKLALAASLAVCGTTAQAVVVPFTVDPGAIGGAEAPFTASYIDFSYSASIDQAAGLLDTSTFTEEGAGFFGTFRHPELSDPPIIGTGLGTSYQLYAVFTGDGSTTTNIIGGIDGNFSNFQLDIFADPGIDTTFTFPGIGGVDESLVINNSGDDIHVATSTSLLANQFRVFPGLAAGDFDVLVEMLAVDTGIGTGLFFATPWDLLLTLDVDFNGVNTSISGFAAPPTAFIDGLISGSGNLSVVPEPSALALLGIGVLGMGFAGRRARA